MTRILRAALTGTCLAALGLTAACNRSPPQESEQKLLSEAALPPLPASLPLVPGAAEPIVAAPEAARLPAAPRPALRGVADDHDDYAYLDRAAWYDAAFDDAPPDYAFAYDEVTPWGWEGYDGWTTYAEPLDVGYRYYYYEPGYDTPYLVRDPGYSYGFDGSSLVVIYDNVGRVVPRRDYGNRWDYAGRYYQRGRDLRHAASGDRRGVIAADWAARRTRIARSNAQWESARTHDAEWRSYQQRRPYARTSRWQAERRARVAAAQRFDADQRRGFQREVIDRRGDREGPAALFGDRHRRETARPAGQDQNSQRIAQTREAQRQHVFAHRAQQQAQRQTAWQQAERRQVAQRLADGRNQREAAPQRQQPQTQRVRQMQVQRERERGQRQQQLQAQQHQQRTQRLREFQAQRDLQHNQRAQQQALAQRQQNIARRQQNAQRVQQVQAQREQQRAQRAQQAQRQQAVQRDQQRGQRMQQAQRQYQAVQGQQMQQNAQRRQQARNDSPGRPGGQAPGRGRDRD